MKKYICLFFLFISYNITSQWFQQNSGTTGDLNSVFFINPLTGWICGVTGTSSTDRIAKSTDGGVTWVKQNAGTFYVMNKIQFINDQTGWAAGIHGTVVKTTNGGTNWFILFGSTSYDFTSLRFINNQTGWISSITLNGIYLTIDGGINWEFIPNILNFKDQYFISYNYGIAITSGVNSTISKTTNGGHNWISISFANTDLKNIFLQDTMRGWIVGDPSKILITTNGGAIWDSLRITNTLIGPRSILFVNSITGYICGVNGVIYKSTNSGYNWFLQQSGVNNNLNNIYFFDFNNGWSVGANGTLLRTTNGGEPVGIEQIGNEIPLNVKLSQNYPNPFNPETKILIDLNKLQFVSLKIYDINGKETETLINKNMSPGKYIVNWNAINYSGGIYFYSLLTDGIQFDTKKMILIK